MNRRVLLELLTCSLFFAAFGAACGDTLQTLNSSAGDDVLFGSDDALLVGASTGFGPARRVILGQCAGCHPNFGTYTESAWQSEGYVLAGAPDSSSVYFRLRGSGSPSANMPPNGTLSSADIQAVRSWIQNL